MMNDDAVLRTLTAEFVAAFNAGDVDRMMRLYGDHYVDVNLPQPRQTSRERADYYRSIVSKRDLAIEVTPDEIIVTGSHAVVRGSLLLYKVDASGARERSRELRYIEVWARQAAGWKSIWGIDAEVHS